MTHRAKEFVIYALVTLLAFAACDRRSVTKELENEKDLGFQKSKEIEKLNGQLKESEERQLATHRLDQQLIIDQVMTITEVRAQYWQCQGAKDAFNPMEL